MPSQLASLEPVFVLNRNGYCIAFSMPVQSHLTSLKPEWVQYAACVENFGVENSRPSFFCFFVQELKATKRLRSARNATLNPKQNLSKSVCSTFTSQ